MPKNKFGEITRSIISDLPADFESPAYFHYKKTIPIFPEEAVYIYSFVERKMIFASGWEEILGYRDDEISLLKITSITSPEFVPFSSELNDKALMFIMSQTENFEKFSFTIELKKIHKNGLHIPLISRIGVFKAINGKVVEIIGRSQISRTLKFGKVMQYATFGPGKTEFEDVLSKELFHHWAISTKEKEALILASQGYSFKEIASFCNVSQSAIEKRIIPLYKRFNVRNLTHLISFAYENHIIN